jgi:WD40 repeat protein
MVFDSPRGVVVADANGRHRRVIAQGVDPHVSPNGRWVAYTGDCRASGCRSFYLVRATGGSPRRLGRAPAGWVAWSPDSSVVVAAYSSGSALGSDIAFEIETGKRQTLARDALDLTFSPNGKWIVFTREQRAGYNIVVAEHDGKHPHQVTHDDSSSTPLWAPDGSITFVRGGGGDCSGLATADGLVEHRGCRMRLWRVMPDGTDVRLLPLRLPRGLDPNRLALIPIAWSRGSDTLLATGPGVDGWVAYTIRGSAGTLRRLGRYGHGDVDISRDGRWILRWLHFDGPQGAGGSLIELVSTQTGRERPLVRDGGIPSWNG